MINILAAIHVEILQPDCLHSDVAGKPLAAVTHMSLLQALPAVTPEFCSLHTHLRLANIDSKSYSRQSPIS